MSAGSFCRSASMNTSTAPRAWSMPAAMAAVWPKFRRSWTMRARRSRRAMLASSAKPASRLPSSTYSTSNAQPSGSIASTRRWWSGTRLPSSSNTGAMIETSTTRSTRSACPSPRSVCVIGRFYCSTMPPVTARLERPLVALLALVALANAAVWARTIPYDHAPDEFLHYAVPAFIADHGRLPVFGPDADMYASTQPPDGSPYSGAYYSSYALFPGLSYLASAGLMRLAEATHPTAELFAARLPSVLSLPVTVWLAYLCAATLARPGSPVRLAVPASVASLPELTFVASYTNTDAYTIAAASLAVFAWCYGARTRWRPRARVLLGLALGLVLLGKYTAYLVAPVSAVVVLASARGWRGFATTCLMAGLMAALVSG